MRCCTSKKKKGLIIAYAVQVFRVDPHVNSSTKSVLMTKLFNDKPIDNYIIYLIEKIKLTFISIKKLSFSDAGSFQKLISSRFIDILTSYSILQLSFISDIKMSPAFL